MEFLDRSGHFFSLESYPYEPIGQEYDESDYIFWINSKKLDKLSVNNYYVKTIYIAIPFDSYTDYSSNEDIIGKEMSFDDLVKVDVTIDSKKFYLISPKHIQNLIANGKDIGEYFKYDINDLTKLKKITNDNPEHIINDGLFAVIFDEKYEDGENKIAWKRSKYAILPIYVLCNSADEGTWLTNVLIHVSNKTKFDATDDDWCYITVGGEFEDTNEILEINGKNIGIELPKGIFRSIYSCSFINNEFNEQIYNEKMKEYLMNYMEIRGEKGNYNSAINSLKWFGYGDHITIHKLLKTDNEIKEQFIRDNFNISYDLINSFKHFRNSAYISLSIKANEETGEINEQTLTHSVNRPWGENTPVLIDNFDRYQENLYDYDNEKFKYIKPYYDFSFYEMGLKLSCLKYYYKKYFLPIYLNIHSASIAHKVYANDVKFTNIPCCSILAERPVEMFNKYKQVEFDDHKYKYFTHQIHYVDNQFNEWNNNDIVAMEQDDTQDFYKIDDICINIPIKFKNDTKIVDNEEVEIPTHFNCVLLIEKEKSLRNLQLPYILSIQNKFNIINDDLSIYRYETRELEDLEKYQYSFSIDNTKWSLWTIGFENFKNYIKNSFNYKIYSEEYDDALADSANMEIFVDVLSAIDKYKVHCNKIHINGDSNPNLTLKDVLKTSEIIIDDMPKEYHTDNYYVYVPGANEIQKNVMNGNDVCGTIKCIPNIYVKMKFDNSELHDIKINSSSIKSNVNITFVEESLQIYESHFSFIQDPEDINTYYNSFVFYPQIINYSDINNYVNEKFNLKLLVNNVWYSYEFETKMPDIDVEFGTLEYKYYQDDNKFTSRFEQLQELSDDKIVLNSFMNERRLVEVNDVNYLENITQYVIKNNIKILTDEHLQYDNLKYVVISLNNGVNVKIFFASDLLGSIDIQRETVKSACELNILDPSIYVLNEELNYIKTIIKNDGKCVWERAYLKNKNRSKYIHQSTSHTSEKDNDILSVFDESISLEIDENNPNYVLCTYHDNDGNNTKSLLQAYDAYFFTDNSHYFLNNFNYNKNLLNNRKILNHVVLYDIYQKEMIGQSIFNVRRNFNIACNGVTFLHDRTITNSTEIITDRNNKHITVNENDGIEIFGTPIWDDNVYSNEVDEYSTYTNFDITMNDDVIYDKDKKEYKFNEDSLLEKYDINSLPISEANKSENDEKKYYYYYFEYFTGKYFYTDKEISANTTEEKCKTIEGFCEFIDDYTILNLNKGLSNASVATLYYKTFNDLLSSSEIGTDLIDYNIENNFTKDNTEIIKNKLDNNTYEFIVKFKKPEEIIFKNGSNAIIQYKVSYKREIAPGQYNEIYPDKYDINEHGLTYEERLKILNNEECENVFIAVDIYMISTKFIYNDPDSIFVLKHDGNLTTKAYITDENNIYDDKIYQGYEDYKYTYLKKYNNSSDTQIVLLKPEYKPVYVNYHNNEKVSDDQPGLYVYNLAAIDDISTKLDNIMKYENRDYQKFILNIEDKNDIAELYTKSNAFKDYDREKNNEEKIKYIDDYEYAKENVYVVQTITDITGVLNVDFDLKFYDNEDDHNNYFTQEEIKSMTCLMVNHKKKESDNKYTNNIFEKQYHDDELKIDINNREDIIEVIIKLSLKKYDEKLKQYSKDNRYKIPKFKIYPNVSIKSEKFVKLKYDKSYLPNEYDSLISALSNLTFSKQSNIENFHNKKVIDLYNEFFKNQYVYKDNITGEITYINEAVYNVERIYKIQQQYEIWSNKFEIIDNTDNENEYAIIVKCDDRPNMIGNYLLYDKEKKDLYKFDENDTNNENIINYHNFAVFSKYKFSNDNNCDFYDCKIYNKNNAEIILDDYVLSSNIYKFISPNISIETYLDYDMYLMHNDEYWYIMYISKDTLGKLDDIKKQNISNEQKYIRGIESYDNENSDIIDIGNDNIAISNSYYYNSTKYELRYVKEENQLMINRFKYNSNNGKNIFNNDELVAGVIKTNGVLPVNIMHSSKWEITPMSYGMNTNNIIESNAEMVILPYSKLSNTYESGYYNVNIRYCLDKNLQHQYTNKAKIRIK